MKLAFKYLFALPLLLTGNAVAQEFFAVRPGTGFPAELHQTIHASRAKAGDLVQFRTLEPVLIGGGVVVPENATLLGKVVFARWDTAAEPRSMLRIRIDGVRWKSGQARINAVVVGMYYVRSAYIYNPETGPRPTFLEGIHISSHPARNASTDFFSNTKDVVLRSGILLLLQHVVPNDDADQTLSASSSAADEPAKK